VPAQPTTISTVLAGETTPVATPTRFRDRGAGVSGPDAGGGPPSQDGRDGTLGIAALAGAGLLLVVLGASRRRRGQPAARGAGRGR
jgi:hypothetical protein